MDLGGVSAEAGSPLPGRHTQKSFAILGALSAEVVGILILLLQVESIDYSQTYYSFQSCVF